MTQITTLAGTGATIGTTTGAPATSCVLNGPRGVWVDTAGTVLVSDTQTNKVRKVFTWGTQEVLSMTGSTTLFGQPRQLFGDSSGSNLYIADAGNNRVLRIETQQIDGCRQVPCR